MDFREKLRKVPRTPGIYIMKGIREKIIYVGKAKNLRNRLRSYFQSKVSLDARKARMVEEIRDFEYIVTGNELEALVLEATYIKRTKPRYNIVLRDDKQFPYLKLTSNEKWPRLEIVRKIERDGAEYFGPYVPAGAMREMLKFIRRTFPIRICRYNLEKPFRPCVQFQMGRCLAPCSEDFRGDEDHARYISVVNEVRSFIQGEKEGLLSSLKERMRRCSDEMRFEEAAGIRDKLTALGKALESQRVIAPELGDVDVIGLYREKEEASVFVLFIRKGVVIGQKDFFFKRLGEIGRTELVAGFIEQFYSKDMLLPPRIFLPFRASFPTEKEWLSRKRGAAVRLVHPASDLGKKVLKMADDNAYYAFNSSRSGGADETLFDIKKTLNLGSVPKRIAAVDISNIAGSEPVGAVIVYEGEKFVRSDYRLFRIKHVSGINDFAMIGEVVSRYLKNIIENDETLPALLLIDGGRGQLDAALSAVKPLGVYLEMVAMAKAKADRPAARKSEIRKDLERVYLPGKRSPIFLEPSMASTKLLQKVRDEVHRAAIGYHKKLRSRRTLRSPLEEVRGIGRTRRLELLKHFESIDAIRIATVDEVASVKGMNRKVAEELKRSLRAGR